jgi:hypothetical protein
MCWYLDAWTRNKSVVGDQDISEELIANQAICYCIRSSLSIRTLSSNCGENLDRTGSWNVVEMLLPDGGRLDDVSRHNWTGNMKTNII